MEDAQDVELQVGRTISLLTGRGEMHVQHAEAGNVEGLIISFGESTTAEVAVRLQSACIFSQTLGAIDCDCALQFNASLDLISREGGYAVYTFEEGRGVGLRSKIDAIGVQQDTGCDTRTAFNHLGLSADMREYRFESLVLGYILGDRPVVLLTNDPRKARAISRYGVNVVSRRGLVIHNSRLIAHYLSEKSQVLGHIIDADSQ